MPEIIDPIEQRDPQLREAELFERLPQAVGTGNDARARMGATARRHRPDVGDEPVDPRAATSAAKEAAQGAPNGKSAFAGLVIGGPRVGAGSLSRLGRSTSQWPRQAIRDAAGAPFGPPASWPATSSSMPSPII